MQFLEICEIEENLILILKTFLVQTFLKEKWVKLSIILILLKGGHSGRMTWQFLKTLELFSPEKIKLSNFCFCLIFIVNKKSSKVANFPLTGKKLCFSLTSQKGEMDFIIFNVLIRQLCISLTHQPKAVPYFENTHKSLTEIIFLS